MNIVISVTGGNWRTHTDYSFAFPITITNPFYVDWDVARGRELVRRERAKHARADSEE